MKFHLNSLITKRVILPAVLLSTLFLSGCTNLLSLNSKKLSVDKNWKEAQTPYSNDVVCSLKISTVTKFEEGHINGEAKIDNKPTVLTFVDIDAENPSIVGNLGDKAPLIKIDNGSTIYLIEKTAFGNLNIFTLFRDKNIMLMSKQYDLFGKPFGLMMIGDCLSGV